MSAWPMKHNNVGGVLIEVDRPRRPSSIWPLWRRAEQMHALRRRAPGPRDRLIKALGTDDDEPRGAFLTHPASRDRNSRLPVRQRPARHSACRYRQDLTKALDAEDIRHPAGGRQPGIEQILEARSIVGKLDAQHSRNRHGRDPATPFTLVMGRPCDARSSSACDRQGPDSTAISIFP